MHTATVVAAASELDEGQSLSTFTSLLSAACGFLFSRARAVNRKTTRRHSVERTLSPVCRYVRPAGALNLRSALH